MVVFGADVHKGRKHLSSARPRFDCQPVNRWSLCRRADGPRGRRRTMRLRDGVRAEQFRRYGGSSPGPSSRGI
jgi:hypothetical protein